MRASRRARKPGRRKEADGRDPPRGVHRRPTPIFCEGFEWEHACRDPKDGELCLSGAKPEETLVEDTTFPSNPTKGVSYLVRFFCFKPKPL